MSLSDEVKLTME